jgi:hypothetical protein
MATVPLNMRVQKSLKAELKKIAKINAWSVGATAQHILSVWIADAKERQEKCLELHLPDVSGTLIQEDELWHKDETIGFKKVKK